MSTDYIDTGKALVSRAKQGYILIEVHEDADMDIDDIKAISNAKFELTKDKRHTVMFVIPVFGNISLEATRYSASKEVNKNAIAKAIVSNSLSGRIISTFFINIIKPPAPTRLFSSKEKAEEWLRKMEAAALKTDPV